MACGSMRASRSADLRQGQPDGRRCPSTASAAPQITGAIRQAAQVDRHQLRLSAHHGADRVRTSTRARRRRPRRRKGLYQFIEQTWLGTMKQAGRRSATAAMPTPSTRSADGRYDVPIRRCAPRSCGCAATRRERDAGRRLHAQQCRQCRRGIGRQPTEGELYIAHFLGPDGAGKLIDAAAQPAAARTPPPCFRRPRRANPQHLLRPAAAARAASARSTRKLAGRFEVARAATGAGTQIRRRDATAARGGAGGRYQSAARPPCRHRAQVPRRHRRHFAGLRRAPGAAAEPPRRQRPLFQADVHRPRRRRGARRDQRSVEPPRAASAQARRCARSTCSATARPTCAQACSAAAESATLSATSVVNTAGNFYGERFVKRSSLASCRPSVCRRRVLVASVVS